MTAARFSVSLQHKCIHPPAHVASYIFWVRLWHQHWGVAAQWHGGCLVSQSSSLLAARAASLCLQFLHAAAALALHLSIAADLPVPAASLNAKTTINGPSSYPRCCSLLQHFVSLRSPFTLIHMLVTVSTSAGGQLLVRSHRSHSAAQGGDAASGAVWGSVSDSRTLENVSHRGGGSCRWQLVPYLSNNALTNG